MSSKLRDVCLAQQAALHRHQQRWHALRQLQP
jgi:hypothetical protein